MPFPNKDTQFPTGEEKQDKKEKSKMKKRFTKWYVKKGYKFGYEKIETIGDDVFQIPVNMPKAYFICPFYIKPLLLFLFSPSIYTAEAYAKPFIDGFKLGLEKASFNCRQTEKE